MAGENLDYGDMDHCKSDELNSLKKKTTFQQTYLI